MADDRDDDLATLLDELRSQHSSGTLEAGSVRSSHPELAEEALELLRAEQALADAAADWRELAPAATASIAGASVPTTGENQGDDGEPLPARIGRYHIRRCLGSGGMGSVYEAHDPQLNRTVALKVPFFPGPPDRQARARRRFLRESHAAAAVEHSHVCQIYDAGEQDGRPFVVMAYVPGESLADRLKRGRFEEPREAVALIAHIADALAAVHARGVIHRDIKPGNILLQVQEPGSPPIPKLTDFGLARRDDDDEALTADGTLVGTPAYMAPEQAGAGGAVTARSDIYGLGAVLYEMLVGRRPYEGTMTQVLAQVVREPVEPLRSRRPELDPGLERIVARAMARDPHQRYPNAAALAGDLRRWLNGSSAPDETVVLSRQRWRPARPWPLIGGLGTLAALLLVAVVLIARIGGRGPSISATPDAPVAGAVATPEKLIRGDITIYVWKKRNAAGYDGEPRNLRSHGVLPVAPGDGLRIEARLQNGVGHMYVLWLDTEGKVSPLFPWDDDWTIDPAKDVPRRDLVLPPEGAAPLSGGPAGIESMILLVRDRPLPPDQADLRNSLQGLPPQDGLEIGSAVWLENGLVIRDELHRGPIKLNEAKAVNDPVLRTQQLIRNKLAETFPYSRAVCFSSKGDR